MSLYLKDAKRSVYISPLKIYNDSLSQSRKSKTLADVNYILSAIKRGGNQKEYITVDLQTASIDQYIDVTTDWFKYSSKGPQWKLLDSTKNIGPFLCRQATTELSGRTYTAWYTEEIPISAGPFKLIGLPGLVLSAEDQAGDIKIELVEIKKSNKGIEDLNLSEENVSDVKNYNQFLELIKASFYNRVHPKLYESFDQNSKKQADERYEARVRRYNNFIER